MQVYLLRHGVAEEARLGADDADRALTEDGREKLADIMHSALRAEVEPSLILVSPLKRAIQTAEIAKKILKCSKELIRTKSLLPGSSVDSVWNEIRVNRSESQLMLVGHEPLFGNAAAFLLGSPTLNVDFKKGALLRVDFDNFPPQPHGVLRWFVTAKLVVSRSRPSRRAVS